MERLNKATQSIPEGIDGQRKSPPNQTFRLNQPCRDNRQTVEEVPR